MRLTDQADPPVDYAAELHRRDIYYVVNITISTDQWEIRKYSVYGSPEYTVLGIAHEVESPDGPPSYKVYTSEPSTFLGPTDNLDKAVNMILNANKDTLP